MQALTEAVAIDGFWLLVTAAAVAGLVRGFSGFGTAMVYLPVAGQILTPFQALTTLMVMDLIGPLPNIPAAIRTGHKRDILRLSASTLVALPLGVLVLGLIAPEVFRYGVSLISLLLLVLLMAGVRYHGTLRPPMVYGTGAVGGFLAGSVGLPGPPVIMLYMASPNPSEVIRANIMGNLCKFPFSPSSRRGGRFFACPA
ncbi:TSUP family transporter [Profundibacter sp.]|uniref:TSUP family transporter n=1 Tax=Profundibacter sp. TaxID=3101071 RepID=UPI003D0D9747